MPATLPSPKSAKQMRRTSKRLSKKAIPPPAPPPDDSMPQPNRAKHLPPPQPQEEPKQKPQEVPPPPPPAALPKQPSDTEQELSSEDEIMEEVTEARPTDEESSQEQEFEDEPATDETVDVASDEEADNSNKMGQVRFAEGTYKSAVTSNNNEVTEIQYQARRFAIMISIPEVENNVDRLRHLVLQVNDFVKFARKRNTKFRLRKFDNNSRPVHKDKSKWRTRMIDNSSADFQDYIYGYFSFTPPRGGTYRLRINAVLEEDVILHDFIQNVTHDWGQRDSRSISDIKAQKIFDPVKIGYLMRATKYITHSYELVTALEHSAKTQGFPNVFMGISWGTIPSPVGGYDKDTAVQAVILETNRETSTEAVKLLQKWFPLNPKTKAQPPYPGNFRFVMNRDHPSVKGNPIAIANLSVLMERQGIFTEDVKAEQSHCLKNISMPYGDTRTSLRHKLLTVKSLTSGEEVKGQNLFMSISKAINNRSGQKSSWFTFHKRVAAEAISIVRNLPAFIKTEFKTDPEIYCYAQFLQHIRRMGCREQSSQQRRHRRTSTSSKRVHNGFTSGDRNSSARRRKCSQINDFKSRKRNETYDGR